jgi:hypothetical protein
MWFSFKCERDFRTRVGTVLSGPRDRIAPTPTYVRVPSIDVKHKCLALRGASQDAKTVTHVRRGEKRL